MKRKADISEIKKAANYRTFKQGDTCPCLYCKWFMKARFYCNYSEPFTVCAYDTCDNAKNWRER